MITIQNITHKDSPIYAELCKHIKIIRGIPEVAKRIKWGYDFKYLISANRLHDLQHGCIQTNNVEYQDKTISETCFDLKDQAVLSNWIDIIDGKYVVRGIYIPVPQIVTDLYNRLFDEFQETLIDFDTQMFLFCGSGYPDRHEQTEVVNDTPDQLDIVQDMPVIMQKFNV